MSNTLETDAQVTTALMMDLTDRAEAARQAGATRREFFSRTAHIAGTASVGLAAASLMRPIAARAAAVTPTPESAAMILDIAATAEALATTFYFNALASASLPNVNSDANRNYFQAAVVQEYEHLRILGRLKATPLATKFYFPDNMFTAESVFFPTAGTLEDYFIAAYLAAAREFSGAVQKGIIRAMPDAIGLAVQIAGIECEHRALLRVAGNQNPPNNIIIEQALVAEVSDAAAALGPFLQGGQGFSGPFSLPGAGEVNGIAEPYGFASFPKYHLA